METNATADAPNLADAVTLRPVAADDGEFLLRVYASTREDELSQVVWPEGAREAFLRSQLAAQRTAYESRFPHADYDVILYQGRPAGRLWVARTPEQIRLLDIALLPEFQNLGIGTHLVERLIEESERTGVALRHMVFELNTEAFRFYERLGFARVDETGMYVLMERRPQAARG
jgi:ribosomal protein S18 acetylase RimI-like enzyme